MNSTVYPYYEDDDFIPGFTDFYHEVQEPGLWEIMNDVTNVELELAQFEMERAVRSIDTVVRELEILESEGVLDDAIFKETIASLDHISTEFRNQVKENYAALEKQLKSHAQFFHDYYSTRVSNNFQASDLIDKKMLQNLERFDKQMAGFQQTIDAPLSAIKKEFQTEIEAIQKLDVIKEHEQIRSILSHMDTRESQISQEIIDLKNQNAHLAENFDAILAEGVSTADTCSSTTFFAVLRRSGQITENLAKLFLPNTTIAVQKLKTAIQISRVGFEGYMKKVTLSEEMESEELVYARVREVITSESEASKAQIAWELEKLDTMLQNGATDAELVDAMAAFNAPSRRLFASAALDMAKVTPNGIVQELLSPVRSSFFALRGIGKTLAGSAMASIETVIGMDRALVIGGLAESVFTVAVDVLDFLMGPVTIGLLFFQLAYLVNKDGFTTKLIDDLLGFIFLSLKQIESTEKYMRHFPDNSKLVSKKHPRYDNILKLRENDYKELKTTVDFWGKTFIRLTNMTGHQYPAYRPMSDFKAAMVIPGVYISEKGDPLVSQQDKEFSRAVEEQIRHGDLSVNGAFRSGTQIAHILPTKKGYIRNFARFPLYKSSFHWPDYANGEPVIISGTFQEHELDPTLVKTWKLWATGGEWGPIYNAANHPATRAKAKQANQADLRQWLTMDIHHPDAWMELQQWIGTNRARLACNYPEMLILAPETFLKQYNSDALSERMARWSHDYSKAYITGTDNYIFSLKEGIGHWPVNPGSRQWYENIVQKHEYWYAAEVSIGGAIVWVRKTRKATSQEIATYSKIYESILKLKNDIDSLKSKTKEQYQEIVLGKIWPLYVRFENPERTVWTYIQRYRNFFIEEIAFYCKFIIAAQKAELWQDWIKARDRAQVPLNMDSAHRAYFFGKFAELAYVDPEKAKTPSKVPLLEQQLREKFGGFDENILVTTSKPTGHWAKEIVEVIYVDKDVDIPIEYGGLRCRVIVLHEPRTLVLCFKGTDTFFEQVVDSDFSASDIGHFLNNEKPTNGLSPTPIVWLPARSMVNADMLLHGNKYFQVHRGFLRAVRKFKEKLSPIMDRIQQKYQNSEKPILSVNYCGHSLGAAMAQISCFSLPRLQQIQKYSLHGFLQNKNKVMLPNLYCISSPRVGDARAASLSAQFTGEVVHLWTDGDIVTAVPPMLYPAKDISKEANSKAYSESKAIFEKDPEVAFLFIALRRVWDAFSLPDIFAPEEWQDFEGKVSAKGARQVLARILWGASQLQAQRFDGTFFRVSPLKSVRPQESNRDINNTASTMATLLYALEHKEVVGQFHSASQTLGRFKQLVDEDNDIFSGITRDLPSWIHRGSDPKPNTPTNPLPPEIIDALLGKNTRIIGTVKTMHKHPLYTQVPLSDIQPGSFIFDPFQIDQIEDQYRLHTEEEARKQTEQVKRRKLMHIEFFQHE